MKKLLYISLFISTITFSQNTEKQLDSLLNKLLSFEVPIIKIGPNTNLDNYLFLDSREPNEFAVSHIKNALNIGYNHFELNKFTQQIPDKNTPIIIYCSIGYRSEKIGLQLINAGYTNVKNLYGGIFSWINAQQPIVDKHNKKTLDIHTYSKEWSRWVCFGNKIYAAE